MSSNIFLRVFGLKGISPNMLNRYPKGKVWCSAELGSHKLETVKNSIGGGALAVNEVSWSATDGFLKWEMSREEISNLKTIQPKIKLHIMIQSEGKAPVSMGYVLVDMRDLTRAEIKNVPLKVHGMTGAEVTVSAKLSVGQFVKEHPTDRPPGPLASSVDVSINGGSSVEGGPSVMSSLAMSTDSVRSVLRLALEESKGSDRFVRFSFSIALEDYHHLALLCEPIIAEDHKERDAAASSSSGFPKPVRTFWLCWTVFDKMFQSDEFQYGEAGPKRVRDTIKVECPLSALESSIAEASPVRIFLCTQDKLLGVAKVPMPAFSLEVLQSELLTSDALVECGWAGFGSATAGTVGEDPGVVDPLSGDVPEAGVAGIKITSTLTFNDVLERTVTAPSTGGADEGYEQDAFEADDNDNDKKPHSVTFSGLEDPVGAGVGAPEPPAPAGAGDGMGTLSMKEEGQEEDEAESADEHKDDRLRHFRVSVHAKTLSGFKRPAHVSVSWTYPHLGTAAAVRTHPQWVLANSELTVDGGSATYECVMSRASLREKLSKYPLKMQALSRSSMGSAAAGATIVDLHSTFAARVHSYRCPVTSRAFKTRAEYSRHRQTLLALRAAGRIDVTPPVDPVYVRVSDGYLGLESADEGGAAGDSARMRVMVCVEELGLVGNELALDVKPGYKMHGAGVYVREADDQVNLEEGLDGGGGGGPTNPLESKGPELTPFEKKKLELLTLEWEGWRKSSEEQWREALREKERFMQKKLEMEAAASLANRADDLRRAHEEAGRLEVRLRTAIDAAEKSRSDLKMKEEQMNLRLAQKTSELQMLQKRVRDEAKARVDAEKHRGDSLSAQVATLTAERDRLELRAKNSEKEYESYRSSVRAMPESMLREEVAKVKAQLAESRAETERERRIRSETELEKEHFRSQMHRLALALKREREKSNTLARQELEQLRLEFLAREERYVLDGDREELRTIRHELASLRAQSGAAEAPPPKRSTGHSPTKAPSATASVQPSGLPDSAVADAVRGNLSTLLATGLYDSQDSAVQELRAKEAVA